jgi:hypothetical protein
VKKNASEVDVWYATQYQDCECYPSATKKRNLGSKKTYFIYHYHKHLSISYFGKKILALFIS